jgi:phage/plasmid-associated DNA primase
MTFLTPEDPKQPRRIVIAEEAEGPIHFEIRPGARLFMTTGHLPKVDDIGQSFWRRLEPVSERKSLTEKARKNKG